MPDPVIVPEEPRQPPPDPIPGDPGPTPAPIPGPTPSTLGGMFGSILGSAMPHHDAIVGRCSVSTKSPPSKRFVWFGQ